MGIANEGCYQCRGWQIKSSNLHYSQIRHVIPVNPECRSSHSDDLSGDRQTQKSPVEPLLSFSLFVLQLFVPLTSIVTHILAASNSGGQTMVPGTQTDVQPPPQWAPSALPVTAVSSAGSLPLMGPRDHVCVCVCELNVMPSLWRRCPRAPPPPLTPPTAALWVQGGNQAAR